MLLKPTKKQKSYRSFPNSIETSFSEKYHKCITSIDEKNSFCALIKFPEKKSFKYDYYLYNVYEFELNNIKEEICCIDFFELKCLNKCINSRILSFLKIDVYKNGDYFGTLKNKEDKFYFDFDIGNYSFGFPLSYLKNFEIILKIYLMQEMEDIYLSVSLKDTEPIYTIGNIVNENGYYEFSENSLNFTPKYSINFQEKYYLINKEDENLEPNDIITKYSKQENTN
jgi:hypothetical protein